MNEDQTGIFGRRGEGKLPEGTHVEELICITVRTTLKCTGHIAIDS